MHAHRSGPTKSKAKDVARNYVTAPFSLIPIPSQGAQLAEFIERHANAMCSHMLPSLDLTRQEKEELVRIDMELLQKIADEPWNYPSYSEDRSEFANYEGQYDQGISAAN